MNDWQKKALLASDREHAFQNRFRQARRRAWLRVSRRIRTTPASLPAIAVVRDLLEEGAQVVVYDPKVPAAEIRKDVLGAAENDRLVIATSAEEAAAGAHALAVVTEWDALRRSISRKFTPACTSPRLSSTGATSCPRRSCARSDSASSQSASLRASRERPHRRARLIPRLDPEPSHEHRMSVEPTPRHAFSRRAAPCAPHWRGGGRVVCGERVWHALLVCVPRGEAASKSTAARRSHARATDRQLCRSLVGSEALRAGNWRRRHGNAEVLLRQNGDLAQRARSDGGDRFAVE